jgi:hypothetical protein
MNCRQIFLPLLGLILVLVLPKSALAYHLEAEELTVATMDLSGQTTGTFQPFDVKYRGDGSLVAGDLGTDGVSEIIIGAGHGQEPKIKIYRQEGSLITEFLAYESTLDSGVNVTLCDLTDDGVNEIITAPKYRGTSLIKIFSADGSVVHSGFYAYNESFRGGVSLACGDLDSDGANEIVTGAGVSGGPHIKTFNAAGTQLNETFAGSATENMGVNVAVGDLDADGRDEIIATRAGIGDPTITYFDLKNNKLVFVGSLPGPANYQNGLQLLSADVDSDGRDEIGVTTNGQTTPTIVFYQLTGVIAKEIKPKPSNSVAGITAAGLLADDQLKLITLITAPLTENQPNQFVKVDVSDQTLYAYENTALVKAHLVSTGTTYFPTPYDTTTVSRKLLWHDYSWNYGANDPRNYSLPNVQYNVQFRPHMYLHSAYWHNNFGHRMSHGCVNESLADAGWIYNWINVNATVTVQE